MATDRTERVLICLRYGIGDVVMELPALRGFRMQHPRARLTVLGAWPAVELLEGDPVADMLVRVQDFGFSHWGDPGSPAERGRVADWLLGQRFDRVLDAGHTVTGIRRVIEAVGLPAFNTGGHLEAAGHREGPGAWSIWNSAVRAWGLWDDGREPVPRLHVSESARRAALEFFLQRRLGERETIGLAPVASSWLKRWPVDRVCELMRRFRARRGCRFVLFGIPHRDRTISERLRQAAGPDGLEQVEPVHLQQTAALIARCSALVSNDTGLMHMGAAVGTPTVGVFGPTSPRVALPPGAGAVSSGIECRHRPVNRFGPAACVLRDRCLIGIGGCIAAVPVDAVAAELERMLPTGRRPPDHSAPEERKEAEP